MDTAPKLVRKAELLRHLLAGNNLKECAREMGMSHSTVIKYARDADFRVDLKALSNNIYARVDEELMRRTDSITERLVEESDAALDALIDMAKNERGMVRFKAAQDILDRNPAASRMKKVESEVSHHVIDPIFLVHAAATAKELEGKEQQLRALNENNGNDA